MAIRPNSARPIALPAPGQAPFLPARSTAAEKLDRGEGDQHEVARNLAEIRRINHHLGGMTFLRRYLFPRLDMLPSPVTVVDIGTGDAGIPLAVARHVQACGQRALVTAIDLSARNLAVAQGHLNGAEGVQLVQADAAHLPLPRQSADYVISSLFLHHLEPEAVVSLLQRAVRAARYGLVMSDLTRGYLPLAAFKLVSPLFARSYLTRHDGALSVRKAYTPDELRALARAAGLLNFHVHTHWPWRMTLVVDK
jgi:ubiquinone/menaquinone biosynthesis C-methylase UbiE